MDKDTIKVADYLPYYGFFYLDYPGKVNAFLYVKGEFIPFDKLYDNYSELELHPLELVILDREDYNGFVFFLSQLKTETEVIAAFRESFDSYREGGGDSLEWLESTFDDVQKNYSNYPTIYRGAIERNLLEWFNVYNEITPFEPLEDEDPGQDQPETTVQKIERLLKEPLNGAFNEPTHIGKIIEALAQYANGKIPKCVENETYNCMNIQINSKSFYTPFKGLNKSTGLTIQKIAEVLHYFIYANDGSQNAIKINSIVQNIKRTYPKGI